MNIRDALVPEDGHQVFARKRRCLQTLPVPVEAANTLLPPDLPLISTPDRPVDTVRLERYVRTAIDRAAGLGIRVIVFGSGAARTCSSDFDRTQAALQVVQHLARWSEWARGSGIRFALEPLRHEESNVINTVAEADAALERIAGSGSGLLVDVYHMLCNADPPESLLACTAPLLHVHVAERAGRASPGTHGEDLRPYFAALRQMGYNDRVTIECIWKDVSAELDRAVEEVSAQWRDAAP